MNTAVETPTTSSGKGWNIGLWVAQIALALLYGMAAYMKLLMSPAELMQMGLMWVSESNISLARIIGFFELLGTIGLILPAATRIMPKLTIYAAMGLAAIQVLAIPFHLYRGEAAVLPFNLIYLALAVFIIWGRTRKAPIAPRA